MFVGIEAVRFVVDMPLSFARGLGNSLPFSKLFRYCDGLCLVSEKMWEKENKFPVFMVFLFFLFFILILSHCLVPDIVEPSNPIMPNTTIGPNLWRFGKKLPSL